MYLFMFIAACWNGLIWLYAYAWKYCTAAGYTVGYLIRSSSCIADAPRDLGTYYISNE